jgi:hypothetical protein
MVLQTETFNLSAEQNRLQDDLDDLRDLLNSTDLSEVPDSDIRELRELRDSLETQLNGVTWALDEAAAAEYAPYWTDDVEEITLAGLTGGEVAGLQDQLPSDAGEGAVRSEFVAAGSPHPDDDDVPEYVDVPSPAPYVSGDQTETDRLGVAAQLPHPFQVWVHERVDELTVLSGNGKLDFDALRETLQTRSTTT